MRKMLLIALLSSSALSMSAFAQSQPFVDGLNDRANYETWFAAQPKPVQDGAAYWASQRSLPNPGSCARTAQSDDDRQMVKGCKDAQRILAPVDVRRKNEPDYKLGWNSYKIPDVQNVPAPVVTAAPPVVQQPTPLYKPAPTVEESPAPAPAPSDDSSNILTCEQAAKFAAMIAVMDDQCHLDVNWYTLYGIISMYCKDASNGEKHAYGMEGAALAYAIRKEHPNNYCSFVQQSIPSNIKEH